MKLLAILIAIFGLNNFLHAQSDILTSVYDPISDEYGYKNAKGEMVIPFGKYGMCFTETIDKFGIVLSEGKFVAIDRKEKVLYEVFPFDNGPDYPKDGVFRIMENEKIGYADAKTGAVIIQPQFDCAWPFEKGVAKVSNDCTMESDGEHTSWSSENWFYINKKGKKVKAPKPEKSKKSRMK